MNNNDIFRRTQAALAFSITELIQLFSADPNSTVVMGPKTIKAKLLREDQDGFQELSDQELSAFLDGLIATRRGLREGAKPQAPQALNRNLILRKFRIAFNFKDEDMLKAINQGGAKLSKSELSAFFRAPSHRHFRQVGNQVMRAFLKGLYLMRDELRQ